FYHKKIINILGIYPEKIVIYHSLEALKVLNKKKFIFLEV
ncbi:MAG: hypothetical protein ACI9EK_002451, partial [Psychroserpens sp.]